MRKILNEKGDIIENSTKGFLEAYSRIYESVPDAAGCFLYRNRRKDKVVLVVGVGSGHDPLFGGFVGKGLADACASGNIFASPNPQIIVETAKAADAGKGVLFLYGNYAGDNMNFDMAEELLDLEGIKTAHIRVWDDCASAPKDRIEDRRGIAGDIYMIKIAGAACDAGLSLEEVVKVMEHAGENISSIGLAASSCTLPGQDKPIFELGENEIEYGMGVHGEPGIERTVMQPAEKLVDRMYAELKKEMDLKQGEELAVLVNSLGSTTLLELNTVYGDLYDHLKEDGLTVHDTEIQRWVTSQEMGGFSITLLRLDAELKKYYDAPCCSPYYAKEQIQ